MAVDLDKLRRFAGADPDESPGLLEDCWTAAVDWYEKAGVPADTAGALYDYWVMNLAAWTESTSSFSSGNSNSLLAR